MVEQDALGSINRCEDERCSFRSDALRIVASGSPGAFAGAASGKSTMMEVRTGCMAVFGRGTSGKTVIFVGTLIGEGKDSAKSFSEAGSATSVSGPSTDPRRLPVAFAVPRRDVWTSVGRLPRDVTARDAAKAVNLVAKCS
jgi:hypothetical protein